MIAVEFRIYFLTELKFIVYFSHKVTLPFLQFLRIIILIVTWIVIIVTMTVEVALVSVMCIVNYNN